LFACLFACLFVLLFFDMDIRPAGSRRMRPMLRWLSLAALSGLASAKPCSTAVNLAVMQCNTINLDLYLSSTSLDTPDCLVEAQLQRSTLHGLAMSFCDHCAFPSLPASIRIITKIVERAPVASVNSQDSQGNAPLHLLMRACGPASSIGSPRILAGMHDFATVLKLAGARGDVRNRDGDTVKAHAVSMGYTGIRTILDLTSCSDGAALSATGCESCPGGSVSTGGHLCTPCGAGEVSSATKSACVPCGDGTPNDDRSECIGPVLSSLAIIGIVVAVVAAGCCVSICLMRKCMGSCCVNVGMHSGNLGMVAVGNVLGGSSPTRVAIRGLESLIQHNSIEVLKLHVEKGLDLNEPDLDTGQRPLILAAQLEASLPLFQYLLTAGASVDCISRDGIPLSHVVARSRKVSWAQQVIQVLFSNGLNINTVSAVGDQDTLLLAAIKSCNSPLALDILGQPGVDTSLADVHKNTPLHIAAAIVDDTLISSLFEKGSDALLKNVDENTPIMCARLARIAPERQLSRDKNWLRIDILTLPTMDSEDKVELLAGEEAYRDKDWVLSVHARFSPSYPHNHEVAAAMALRNADVHSLTDAIEGAWLGGQSPPYKPAGEVHVDIMKAIKMLVEKLTEQLQKGLESKDAPVLEQAIEMVRYARVEGIPQEKKAISMLVRIKLENASRAQNELELKQALMVATQYGQTDSELFQSSQQMLETIVEAKRIAGLVEQLRTAIEQKDLDLVSSILKREEAKPTSLSQQPLCQEAKTFLVSFVEEELSTAVTRCSLKAMRDARTHAEDYNLTHLPGYAQAKGMPRTVCLKMLKEACSRQNEVGLKDAINETLREAEFNQDLQVSELKGSPEFRAALVSYRQALNLPDYFAEEDLLKKAVDGRVEARRDVLTDARMLQAFQALFDQTHSKVRTRDRRGDVPNRLVVKEVIVVKHAENLISYLRKRQEIRAQLEIRDSPMMVNNLSDKNCAKTLRKLLPMGRQFHQIWKDVNRLSQDTIDPSINEYYMYHGTTPDAADKITQGDFRVDLAGSNAGTLYGRGIYFGESSAKSDEYAQSDSRGLSPMLVCRVLLGRIKYTDEAFPSPDRLVQSCVSGESHSVLGDREKCRNTFREFIVYDNDQAYPEFIVWYDRVK